MSNRHTPELSEDDRGASWTRESLLSRTDYRWDIEPVEQDELVAAVRDCRGQDRDSESLQPADFVLPKLGPKLAKIQAALETGPGVAWLSGLPIEGWSEAEAITAFYGLAAYVGQPVSQAATGETIFHVRDVGLPPDHPQARGPSSNRSLSFHTDRCDVIGFLCLRQAESGGDNDVVSSARVYQEMRARHPELLQVLLAPFLYQRHNVDTGNERPYYELPIFSFADGRFACFLLRVLIERAYAASDTPEMTSQQREALDTLAAIAEEDDLRFRFRQQRGDVLFLNNFVTLHRRTEFVDHPRAEMRRHLLRLWLAVPNSRPLVSQFAAAFGACQAGAIRGGMQPQAKSS